MPRIVLIVEDDRNLARAMAMRLQAEGYRTLVAQDAYYARRLARLEAPDLVVMDVQLPAGDGFTVHEAMLEMPTSIAPVIYVTGCGDQDISRRAEALGARHVFTKPLNMERFLAAVRFCVPPDGFPYPAHAVATAGDLS